jgi:hypothetical protein
MEKYEKKIKVNLSIGTILDPNGLDATITYVNKDDLFIPFILKQNIKDLGLYTEVIDLGGFWDTTNNGSNDFGQNPISSDTTNPYDTNGGNAGDIFYGNGTIIIRGCTDPNALNYNSSAASYASTNSNVTFVDDGSCNYPEDIDLTVDDTTTDVGSPENLGGGLFRLSSTYTLNNIPSESVLKGYAEQWCKATYPSCNPNWTPGTTNSYPILADCVPNGCPSSSTQTCCPGPQNTYRLFVPSDCNGDVDCGDYDVDYGNAQSILCNSNNPPFPNILITVSPVDPNNQQVTIKWYFYCIQD